MKIILKTKIENNLILIEFENSLKLRKGVCTGIQILRINYTGEINC
jgi:hypothetical protein